MAIKVVCECGNDKFRLEGIQLEAVCTECGSRDPLGVKIRLPTS